MDNLKEKTSKYTKEKSIMVLNEVLAKVYSDGYKEGYIDCENEIEYIDLGLPSGTLWAADYERKYGEIVHLSFTRAFLSYIPTVEQWKELISKCRWEFKGNREESKRHLVCTGPNGNSIRFYQNGTPEDGDSIESFVPLYFWINDTNKTSKNVVFMDCKYDKPKWKFEFIQKESNKGDKFPLRLDRNK